jgi:DNA-binding NtrC family response regulator
MTAATAPASFAVPGPRQLESATLLNLLIVDEDRIVRETAREAAALLGYRAAATDSAEQGLRLLESQTIDVTLLDLRVTAAAIELLRQIKRDRPETEVIVIAGHGTVESAVQAMKAGAYDYVTKPFSLEELKLLLERVAAHLKLKVENRILREKISQSRDLAASSDGHRRWTSCTGSLLRPRTVRIPF